MDWSGGGWKGAELEVGKMFGLVEWAGRRVGIHNVKVKQILYLI